MCLDMVVLRAQDGRGAFEGEIVEFRKAGAPRGRKEVPPRFNFITFEADDECTVKELTDCLANKRWRWDFELERIVSRADGEPFDPNVDVIRPPVQPYRDVAAKDESLLEAIGSDVCCRERLFDTLYRYRKLPAVRIALQLVRYGGAFADIKSALRSLPKRERAYVAMDPYTRRLCGIKEDGELDV